MEFNYVSLMDIVFFVLKIRFTQLNKLFVILLVSLEENVFKQ